MTEPLIHVLRDLVFYTQHEECHTGADMRRIAAALAEGMRGIAHDVFSQETDTLAEIRREGEQLREELSMLRGAVKSWLAEEEEWAAEKRKLYEENERLRTMITEFVSEYHERCRVQYAKPWMQARICAFEDAIGREADDDQSHAEVE